MTRNLWRALSVAPAKTAIHLITTAPIALLAWPPFREWAVSRPFASAAFATVIGIRAIDGAWRAADKRKFVKEAVKATQLTALPGIELLRAYYNDSREGRAPQGQTLRRIVEDMLESTVQLVRHGMQLPDSAAVHANLMLPMVVRREKGGALAEGIGIVAYNTHAPPNPSWTKVLRGDLLAGTVIEDGKVVVVEDTRDPVWAGAFSSVRSNCFVVFPIGTPGNFLGVLNIDAEEPQLFRSKQVKKFLWPLIAPQLSLLAQLLEESRAA